MCGFFVGFTIRFQPMQRSALGIAIQTSAMNHPMKTIVSILTVLLLYLGGASNTHAQAPVVLATMKDVATTLWPIASSLPTKVTFDARIMVSRHWRVHERHYGGFTIVEMWTYRHTSDSNKPEYRYEHAYDGKPSVISRKPFDLVMQVREASCFWGSPGNPGFGYENKNGGFILAAWADSFRVTGFVGAASDQRWPMDFNYRRTKLPSSCQDKAGQTENCTRSVMFTPFGPTFFCLGLRGVNFQYGDYWSVLTAPLWPFFRFPPPLFEVPDPNLPGTDPIPDGRWDNQFYHAH